MHILLTNDDGISAPGIRALADGMLSAEHRITVCAPSGERSAASHSATLSRSIAAESVEFPGACRAWSVDGTPADCASLGIWLTRDDPVDLVVSGINYGMNLGGACVYSGTVGAAMEAAMCGVQALAVSLCVPDRNQPSDYSTAGRVAARVADWISGHPLPRGCIYNLNVPSLPYESLRGLVPARLSPIFLSDPDYIEESPGHYRFNKSIYFPRSENGDVELTDQGFATLTMLTWDFRWNAPDGLLSTIGL